MCLHFSTQFKNILKHTNAIYVQCSQLVNHYVIYAYTHNTIKHTHAKILVSALECHVSQDDTN